MPNKKRDYSEFLLTYIGVIFIKSVMYEKGRAKFNVVCTNCGREYKLNPLDIIGKNERSCCSKCCPKNTQDYSKKALSPKEAQISIVFSNYKSKCKMKGREFKLDKKDFTKLVLSDCHYCGSKPSNLRKDEAKSRRGSKTNCYLNGVDRVDSEKGYTIENSLPCCEDCNRAKRNLSYNQFLTMVKNIYETLNLKESDKTKE